jgi:hypothetical protein
MNLKNILITTLLTSALALGARAQSFPPPFNGFASPTNMTGSNTFTPGKIVVYRIGEIQDTNFNIASVRQQPAFIEEWDTTTNNQSSPLLSIALPTNDPNNTIFVNAHAGSEGQGFTRSADRQYLTMTGYTSPINIALGTPSSATNSQGYGAFSKGFGLLDNFGNFGVAYGPNGNSEGQEWYGIVPGIGQNNPRGICTDGTNSYWGAGTVAGAAQGGQFVETGTLYYNTSVGGDPELVQSIVDSSYYTKIINNVLYMVCQNETNGATANGIFNFVDLPPPDGTGNPVPLPWLPGSPYQHIVTTNLFLNFGSTYSKILTFDMNDAGTIVYAADNKYGIVKFTNNGSGTWSSPYIFSTTNIGTTKQPAAAQGCFGILVDFSGANPIIYATTMEEGDGKNTCSNRLIRVVDNGNPGTNMVAQTLVQAGGINEVLRGVAFAPDLRPAILSDPANVATTNGGSAIFSVTAQAVTQIYYQWQTNGVNVSGQTNPTLTLSSLTTNNNGEQIQCIVTNLYGAVTSAPPALLTVTRLPVPPSLTNGIINLTNYVGDTVQISVNPAGDSPFTYQWYFGSTLLTNDGVKYAGTTGSTLYITNVQLSDIGNYYISITNVAGSITHQEVANLNVIYLNPAIGPSGEPTSLTMLVGQTNTMSVSEVTGTERKYFAHHAGYGSRIHRNWDQRPDRQRCHVE